MAIEDIRIVENRPDGSKKEIEVDKAAQGYHNYLVMFDTLLDLDFAMLKMIQAEYNNPKYIDQKIMNLSVKEIRFLLINRDDPNPLTICIHDKKIADDIYKEIMTTRYFDLLSKKYLSITGIFFLMSVYSAIDNVTVNIVCGNKQEEEIIRRYHKKVNVIIPEKLSDINVDDYTEFIFKNKTDVYKFGQLFKEKRILLMSYRFNVVIDDNTAYPDPEISGGLWYSGVSKTVLIDVYNKNEPDYAELVTIKKKPKN